jgi:hypothetical protein
LRDLSDAADGGLSRSSATDRVVLDHPITRARFEKWNFLYFPRSTNELRAAQRNLALKVVLRFLN